MKVDVENECFSPGCDAPAELAVATITDFHGRPTLEQLRKIVEANPNKFGQFLPFDTIVNTRPLIRVTSFRRTRDQMLNHGLINR